MKEVMNDKAFKIFDSLPIVYTNDVKLYLEYLWNSFNCLEKQEDISRSFAIFPFYLLFILAIQYKVLRISKYYEEDYHLMTDNLRVSKYTKDLMNENTMKENFPQGAKVFTVSYCKERKIFEYLDIVEPSGELCAEGKKFVGMRNNYAHASGNIENEIDFRIEDYLSYLEKLQKVVDNTLNLKTQRNLKKFARQRGDSFKYNHTFTLILETECLTKEDFRNGPLNRFYWDNPSISELVHIDS
jgi:hypothetical protein